MMWVQLMPFCILKMLKWSMFLLYHLEKWKSHAISMTFPILQAWFILRLLWLWDITFEGPFSTLLRKHQVTYILRVKFVLLLLYYYIVMNRVFAVSIQIALYPLRPNSVLVCMLFIQNNLEWAEHYPCLLPAPRNLRVGEPSHPGADCA